MPALFQAEIFLACFESNYYSSALLISMRAFRRSSWFHLSYIVWKEIYGPVTIDPLITCQHQYAIGDYVHSPPDCP